MSNLRLPTSGSTNWGSGLNAYLESLNSRLINIENSITRSMSSNGRIMNNIGAYSSGLVGNKTNIRYIKETSGDIVKGYITVDALNAYIGGDILTYFDIPLKTYKEEVPVDNQKAYYVYLQYDIGTEDFTIEYCQNFNGFNYTQILIGMYYNERFAPFYMSNLKSIAQHLDEFERASVDLDTHNVGIKINLEKKEGLWNFPEVSFGIIDNTGWANLPTGTGPIFKMSGIGYSPSISGDSKWYATYDQLNEKTLNLPSSCDFLYLQDELDENNKLITSIAASTDTTFSPESTNIFKGHYYRILLSVFDNLIIIQKSTESHFMSFNSYKTREQNLYNVKFNNNFLLQNKDNPQEYDLALDALFCVEVGRFAVNDLKNYTKDLSYQTGSITYPGQAVEYEYTRAQMCATANETGLYRPNGSTQDSAEYKKAIQSAVVNNLAFVQSNNTVWECIESYESPCTDSDFYQYWQLIDTTQGAASLQANFVFVPALNKGVGSQMKWNIWQTTQGRLNCDVIDFATNRNTNPSQFSFEHVDTIEGVTFKPIINFNPQKWLPYLINETENESSWTNNVLFERYHAKNQGIFLGTNNYISLNISKDDSDIIENHSADSNAIGLHLRDYTEDGIFIACKKLQLYDLNDNTSNRLLFSQKIRASAEEGSIYTAELDLDFDYINVDATFIVNSDAVGWRLKDYTDDGVFISCKRLELHDLNDNTFKRLLFSQKVREDSTRTAELDLAFDYINVGATIIVENDHCIQVTSDKRLKHNIELYQSNALQTVRETPIVTFNYLRSQKPILGMIAQDLRDNVDNPELLLSVQQIQELKDAYTIHETKLIYILWKAVQELSDELNELKKLSLE